MSDWVENIADLRRGGYAVLDGMGAPVDNVVRAREIEGGVEVVFTPTNAEGTELVGTIDGMTIVDIEARAEIPGGMLVRLGD